jgi:hypothetical protein
MFLLSEMVLGWKVTLTLIFLMLRSDFGDLDPVSTRVGASMQSRCMRPALDVV